MSSTEHDARSTSDRFSEALRSATTDDHEAAAVSNYMNELLEGKLSRDEYGEMVAQHYFAYVVLEAAAEAMRDDPVAGPFVMDALTRVPTTKLEDFLVKLETEMLPENAIETDYRSSRNTVRQMRRCTNCARRPRLDVLTAGTRASSAC